MPSVCPLSARLAFVVSVVYVNVGGAVVMLSVHPLSVRLVAGVPSSSGPFIVTGTRRVAAFVGGYRGAFSSMGIPSTPVQAWEAGDSARCLLFWLSRGVCGDRGFVVVEYATILMRAEVAVVVVVLCFNYLATSPEVVVNSPSSDGHRTPQDVPISISPLRRVPVAQSNVRIVDSSVTKETDGLCNHNSVELVAIAASYNLFVVNIC
ncbi:hypothetical protein GQX74_014680 [Glossina fuscipes]|nr:hypothetical protein GQX74_014680 [Glossina fuscipes]